MFLCQFKLLVNIVSFLSCLRSYLDCENADDMQLRIINKIVIVYPICEPKNLDEMNRESSKKYHIYIYVIFFPSPITIRL
jgi:hypothetical protein